MGLGPLGDGATRAARLHCFVGEDRGDGAAIHSRLVSVPLQEGSARRVHLGSLPQEWWVDVTLDPDVDPAEGSAWLQANRLALGDDVFHVTALPVAAEGNSAQGLSAVTATSAAGGDACGSAMGAAAGAALERMGLVLSVAESCTGGLIGHWLTQTAGSSQFFAGGIVAYSNSWKERLLGVSSSLLVAHGAVSQEVVEAMALGALELPGASIALATSGIAGPGGGSPGKPVGTVHMAVCLRGWAPRHRHFHFAGDRASIKQQAAAVGLDWVRRAALAYAGSGH